MPETGAPVATAKPAHAPPVIEYLFHALCFGARQCAVPYPKAVPISTDGPSLPRGTPIRKVIIDITKTPTKTFNQSKGTMPLKIAIEDGMPPPRKRGECLYILSFQLSPRFELSEDSACLAMPRDRKGEEIERKIKRNDMLRARSLFLKIQHFPE